MSTVSAYAAPSATEPLAKTTIERRDPGSARRGDRHQVRRHLPLRHPHRQGEWGRPTTRSSRPRDRRRRDRRRLRRHQVTRSGDRVGVGCFVDSCRECSSCQAGLEQYCKRGASCTYNAVGNDGTADVRRLLPGDRRRRELRRCIPDSLPLDAAAPLLCAGITLYSPLRHWNAGPGKKVAIVGMGGLGHMGVKIGAAMGAEVTVLSQSLTKKEDGLRLGAKPLLRHQRPDDLREAARHLRPDHQHRSRRSWTSTPISACSTSTARWSNVGASRAPDAGAALRADPGAAQPVRLDDRRDQGNAGDAGLLRQARHRRPRSR